jgi:hypothetical protein
VVAIVAPSPALNLMKSRRFMVFLLMLFIVLWTF